MIWCLSVLLQYRKWSRKSGYYLFIEIFDDSNNVRSIYLPSAEQSRCPLQSSLLPRSSLWLSGRKDITYEITRRAPATHTLLLSLFVVSMCQCWCRIVTCDVSEGNIWCRESSCCHTPHRRQDTCWSPLTSPAQEGHNGAANIFLRWEIFLHKGKYF